MTIQETIQKMMTELGNNSSGLLLFSQNTREILYHKEGDRTVFYGKSYAKPTKRFSRLLTVDREILILFSNFHDQQVRTISKVRELIDASEGRLEPTVAIVVHSDKYANLKLKKWGRQKGISILPLYYDIEQDFPREDNLEKLLCSELFSHDPFDISGPVSDDSQFYGRRSEALDMARKLNAGQIRSYLVSVHLVVKIKHSANYRIFFRDNL
jgi:hypothetical protein